MTDVILTCGRGYEAALCRQRCPGECSKGDDAASPRLAVAASRDISEGRAERIDIILFTQVSSKRGIVESPYPRGCRRRDGYLTIAQIIALFAPIGNCRRIGVIVNEQGKTRAVLTLLRCVAQLLKGAQIRYTR